MKKILLSLTLFTGALWALAQDAHFSQYNMAPLNLNPAYTAADVDLRGSVNYRTQWKGVTTPYKTIGASFETGLGKLLSEENRNKAANNLAAGISFLSDRAGDANMGFTQANLTIATHIPLAEKMKLGAAFYGGIGQKSIREEDLSWDSQYNGTQYDQNLPTNENFAGNNFGYQDLGAGLLFQYGGGNFFSRTGEKFKAHLGVAGAHVNKPRMSYYNDATKKLDIKTTIHGGALIALGASSFDLAPSFIYVMQGKATELTAGLLLKANLNPEGKYAGKVGGSSIGLGAYMRSQDSFIAALQLELGNIGIGVSYDLGNAQINNAGGKSNALELSLRFVSPNPHQASKPE